MEEALPGRMGRYALLGQVGRGGMGEVHRARAFGAAGVTKELCIKRIRCERLADPVALGRFVAEARVSMRLSHANIVSVFDFGRSENDYYLAMEWVDGCDLRQLLGALAARGARLEEDAAILVAAEVARGLSYLHGLDGEERLAHCDLKPANVLVSRAGEVKLADFGVAVAETSAAAGGTRRYMAPEQWSDGAVGPAVDLYALGLLLDEMLGGTASRRAEGERPPARYTPPEGVDPAIAALLARLCAHDPADRPASATEVVDALEALLAEARVRTKRSPRDLLVREVAALSATAALDETPADFRTDASYVTEGESETFARRMRPDASPRTESRDTPMPPRPPRPSPLGRIAPALLVALVLAIALSQWTTSAPSSVAPEPGPSAHTTPTPSVLESAPPPATLGTAPQAPDLAPPSPLPPSAPSPRTSGDRSTRPAAAAASEPSASALPAPALAPPAVLRLNARPWAEVTIDGAPAGVTPLVGVSLAPGAHDIGFANPALGTSRTEHLELAAGERRDVIVDLRAP